MISRRALLAFAMASAALALPSPFASVAAADGHADDLTIFVEWQSIPKAAFYIATIKNRKTGIITQYTTKENKAWLPSSAGPDDVLRADIKAIGWDGETVNAGITRYEFIRDHMKGM